MAKILTEGTTRSLYTRSVRLDNKILSAVRLAQLMNQFDDVNPII